MHWTEDCICNRSLADSRTLEFFKISDSRTELGAADAKVLWVGGMNLHVQKRLCHSSELGQKRNVWLCVKFSLF